jgi:transcription-repair coupling factor (superfamily II helicase)
MQEIINSFGQSSPVKSFLSLIKQKPRISLKNISGSARSFLAIQILASNPVIFVTKDDSDYEERLEEIVALAGIEKSIGVTEEAVTQIEFWQRVWAKEKFIAVMKKEVIELPAPQLEQGADLNLKLVQGKDFRRNDLLDWLDKQNYEMVDLVTEPGEFAFRGGILDVFPEKNENPIRIEFFGDEISSLRYFDTLTQRSIQRIETIDLPARKILTDTEHTFLFPMPNDFVILSEINIEPMPNPVINFDDDNFNLDLGFLKPSIYLGNFSILRQEIETSNLRFYIIARDDYQQERLKKILGEKPRYLVGVLNGGFVAQQDNYAVLTEREIYGVPVMRLPKRRFKGLPVDDLLSLKKGDYVVHINYGVGIFEGTKRLRIGDKEKDFLYLRYAGKGKLYLPIENLGLLDRYVATEEEPPVLDRLGGKNWLWVKERAAKAATVYAEELIDLYAKRMVAKGFRFSPDTEWQSELEASFPYQETADQLKAWQEVKTDMQSGKLMDRLICGDVGFGKTEVALRAAFKSVMDGKQVVMLVPTTILCYQHFNTFRRRLDKFPIKVAMLSRFVSRERRKAISEELKNGKVDIVIGTHALLSAVGTAKDIGLLIIDEEQKFGVRQKEKIKQLKAGIDVLTLTATPIPRSLYMSLVGLRDISTIHTPPVGRKEINTEVIHWNNETVRARIRQEINRNGQVFIVHNRIESLPRLVKRIQRLCPDLRIIYAHGRMPERLLADVYLNFVEGNYDILITTAIIESGIDMPRVNTIIVDRADWFGLADLHQLRGRVGRSKEQAYALFIVPEPEKMSQVAKKRLSAIQAYSQLDSGFKLAMRDMEIRGIGNLLGAEQHGHVTRVGFSLYVSLLKEAVAKLKGEAPSIEPDLSFDVEAYIPEDFIAGSYERVAIYRRLLTTETIEEIAAIKEELVDRFGQYPPIIENLFKIGQIRILACKKGILKIMLKENHIIIIGPKIRKELAGDLDQIINELKKIETKD